MSVAAFPSWLIDRKRGYRFWVGMGALVGVLAGGLYWSFAAKTELPVAINQAQIYEVTPIDMVIKLKKDGEMNATDNIDILCQVEGNTAITQIVKEGVSVKKGDVLLTLDSTAIRQKIEDTSLDLQKAEADLTNAKELLEIQKSKNAADLEAAEVSLSLSKLDLKQYEEGSYPQQLSSAKVEVDMAKIALANRMEDLEQTRKLYTKDFVTFADVKKAELDVTTAQNALDKAVTALKVLADYSHDMDLTSKKSTVLQAEQKVMRTRRENSSQLAARQADLTAKEQALTLLKRRFDRQKDQFAACTVTAPADGMVIYGSTTDRNAQTPIQEGTLVRERQLLVRLPDTTEMKAVVRINENVVSKLKEGQRAMVSIMGVPQPVPAKLTKIAVVADSSNRWWSPDLREYPVDLVLEKTPPNLKPGMGATVEIFVDRITDTLAVPLDAVYSVGNDRYVFQQAGDAIKPVKVRVGTNNDTHVQILEGLVAGVDVLRLQAGQGRDFVEKAGIKVEPASRPAGRKSKRPTDTAKM